MAGQGAPKNNDYAEKEVRGKTISLYLSPDILPAIEKILVKRCEEPTEKACLKEAKKYALEGIAERIAPSPFLDQLRFMVSNWQALSNHAEVFAPELLQNNQWIAMKADLERRTDEIGVTAFIQRIADEYRERIEQEDDEDS